MRRDAGVNAIESLMERRGKFDYILLETTGLAEPGNLAPLFWVDDGLGSSIYLDGIVVVVDARHILRCLEERPTHVADHDSDGHEHSHSSTDHGPHLTTAHLQISHADVVIINKSDLVYPHELIEVRSRIRSINGLAKLHITSHSRVQKLESVLLDLHAYETVTAAELNFASKGHSHLDPVRATLLLRAVGEED